MNYEKEKKIIPQIVKSAFELIIEDRFYSQDYTQYAKGNNDIVTDCDIEVEKYIIHEISEKFVGDSFVSEELNSENKIQSRTWIIDPIDGTVNFSKRLKLFGVQVALIDNGEPVFSTIYIPFMDEMYVAIKNKGAYLNGDRIYTSDVNTLMHSIITFGDFSSRKNANETREKQIKVINNIYNKIKKFKMFGAACIDFTSLASSKTDAHIIFTRNVWDLLPGYLLAIEAGAVSNYNFDNPDEFVIIASNATIMKQLMNEVGDING